MHFPHSDVAFVEEYTVVRTSLKVARFASRASGGAVSACHPLRESLCMLCESYFGEKVQDNPR